MRKVIFDCETDALINPKRLWLIVAKDIETNEYFIFKEPDREPKAFLEFSRTVSHWIGHNAVAFDYICVSALVDKPAIDPATVIDTLVLSRLLKYKLDDGQGHGLEAWGERLGSPKHPTPDFSKYSDTMRDYCIQDVDINHKLYTYLKSHMGDGTWDKAMQCEMDMAWIALGMELDGFKYDRRKADELRSQLEVRRTELDKEITYSFPPKPKGVREYRPRATKHGTISRTSVPRSWTDLTYVHVDCPFTLLDWVPFNPSSPRQVVERLDNFGWKPTVRTKGGDSWKLCEDNFATLPASAPKAAHSLIERMIIETRIRKLDEWSSAYSPATGRVHGKFLPIGTWTGRMAHRQPNMGNISAEKSIKYKGDALKRLATSLGRQMRELWIADDSSSWLVGTDAEGIQLRIFAHYINDPKFTESLIHGNKDSGTDPHSINAGILGCTRDTAKTFIYAFLLGAGDAKIGEILGVDANRGRLSKDAFIAAYPGLRLLKDRVIPGDAARGYFIGLDGRKVYCNDEHLMLAGYLQNGETVVMKHANILWRKELNGLSRLLSTSVQHDRSQDELRREILYKQVNFVHDEWQTNVRGSKEDADYVGRIQAASIQQVGRELGVKCPLAGQYSLGRNWLETH